MQRLGRRGHPTYRVVVQDSRSTPTSGKYVALLGSYDPHTKQTSLVRDKAEFYLTHGAQPSDRVVSLFKSEKIKLPGWVSESTKQKREIRNPDKLRKNRPAESEAKADKPAAATEAEDKTSAEQVAEASTEEPKPAEEAKTEEKPAEPEQAEAEKPSEDTKQDTKKTPETDEPKDS